MAPHLDGVHVVFGLVISGFEVIKRIEGLKTDSASRPYADVRVVDCGQLITKSANDVLQGKRRRMSHSADSSLSSQDSSSEFSSSYDSDSRSDRKHRHHKQKKRAKSQRSKKRRRGSKREAPSDVAPSGQRSPADGKMAEEEEDGEKGMKREKPVVRPEDIPPVPENRFLLRRDMPAQEEKPATREQQASLLPSELKPAVTKSGRKMKGRGTMRYHTPPGSKSRSASEEERGSSETPPHWKEEMERTKTYQPPCVEKWSKGEKLNEHSPSGWDNRSKTLSPELSSDRSSQRSSQDRRLKKEKKKAKRKKKAKKRKQAKRRKGLKSKLKDPALSEGERSPSSGRRSKVSSRPDRKSSSPSCSPSTQISSRRKPSSASGKKRRRSSLSSRDSHSYSRSYSRSRSRSRGRFRSSSKSRSRSWSMSRSPSRSRSRSRYRSRSLSRSRRRRLSRSPRKARLDNVTKPKPESLVQQSLKGVETKPTPGPATPAPENAPVIPMSDSPPPSRWKPDQKPWKPSYVRIEEIKAKTTPASLTPTGQAASIQVGKEVAPSTTQESHPDHSHSGRSHGNKSHRHKRRSRSRSSRSRSHSRSYSGSRSGSRSRSRSPGRYDSRSSSSNRSKSYDSHKRSSSNKKTVDRVWKQYYKSLKRIKHLDKYLPPPNAQNPLSEPEDQSGSEHSRNASKASSSVQQITDKHRSQEEAKAYKPSVALALEEHNSKSEWDSDGDKLGKKKSPSIAVMDHGAAGKAADVPDKRLAALAGWDSESDSEKMVTKIVAAEPKHLSEKEEGEASSESEHHDSLTSYHKTNKAAVKPDTQKPSSPADAPGLNTETAAQAERHKSRKKAKRKHKHKRRSATKPGSHRAKEKGKRSKRKHQKLKETFHWQPPLEFGEEEEEEDSHKEKHRDQKHVSVKDLSSVADRGRPGQSPATGPGRKGENPTLSNNRSVQPEPCSETAKKSQASSKQSESQDLSANKMDPNSAHMPRIPDQLEALDDMEICTPEHGTLETLPEPPAPQVLSKEPWEAPLTNPLHMVTNDGEFLSQALVKHSVISGAIVMTARGQNEESLLAKATRDVGDFKWRPLKGMSAIAPGNPSPVTVKTRHPDSAVGQVGVRMEIKSRSRVRPGSLFDEVRKTARLNQRPRNQDSSSGEESSPQSESGNRRGSRSRSPRKSHSASRHRSFSRGRSPSYSRSRSRSSSSYSSRSRSSSHRRDGRRRSRSRSSTYRSYKSHSRTSSRSHSRSRSYGRRRRSRSHSDDSYSSRSRSVSRRHGRRRRSDSSRSSRSSSRSSSRHSSPSRSSRYS